MKFKNFIMIVWQLPQNLLGFVVGKICKAMPYIKYEDADVYSWDIEYGLSLGNYIFVPYRTITELATSGAQRHIKHEYGHTVQSKYLGWFYLLVIGLPSLVWAGCFEQYRQKTGTSYYDFFTEKWANILGGVVQK